jgi:hypothetical protein
MQNQFSDLGISLVQALTEMKIVIPTDSAKNHSVIAVQHYRCSGISQNWNRKQPLLDCLFYN